MRVLLPVQHLVDRVRHPRKRADAVYNLRKQLRALPSRGECSAEAAALADKMAKLREQLTLAIGAVTSCSKCALKHPEPFGHYAGGHCCGGSTAKIFTDQELLALKLSGTEPLDFVPPHGDMAGCVFRGSSSCSLDRKHRPTICVHYTCRQLEHEIRERGDLKHIRALQTELRQTFERFCVVTAPPDI